MRQVTLHIPNNKYPLFLEFAKSIDFIKKIDIDIEEEPTSEVQILKGLKQAVDEVNLAKKGKLKMRDARDLINEL
jgi:hypothetical protein